MCKSWGLVTVYAGNHIAKKLLWRPQVWLLQQASLEVQHPAQSCLTLRQSAALASWSMENRMWKKFHKALSSCFFLPSASCSNHLYISVCVEKKLTIFFLFSFREKLENFGSTFKRWKQERGNTKTSRRNQTKTYFGTLLWARGLWDVEGITSKVSLIFFCF